MLSQLPNELILHIICQACTYNTADSQTLWALSLVSYKFNKLMHDNRTSIIEFYTLINITEKYTQYLFCGRLHRDNDLPAVICNSGIQYWYQHGEQHRDNDLPAVIYTSGIQYWYQHNQLHRDNGRPAVIFADGIVEYWINGKRIQ